MNDPKEQGYRQLEDGWHAYEYKRAAITADNVIFAYDTTSKQLKLLLVKRGEEPNKGDWALPGGFLRMNETIEECAERELKEETNYENAYQQQFEVFSKVCRDPRYRVVTVAFYALVPMREVVGGDDAQEARWFDIKNIPSLAFDHNRIVMKALQHLKEDLHFHPVGFELLPEYFTMPQLQSLYEAILGVQFERRNFAKKMLATGILEKAENKAAANGHRPADLYRFNQESYNEFKEKRNMHMEF